MEIDVETLSKGTLWRVDLLMILVSLGTQDRSFERLLKAIEKQIKLGNIKERVVVQAGETKYASDCMEIFDLIPSSEFLKLLDECDVLLCHGGVGTIIDGLKHHKKIIAAARLKEYGEHQNNHQKQIIKEFVEKHLILELEDFDALAQKLEEIQDFVPAEYESNTKYFVAQLEDYIDESLKNNKGNAYRKLMQYAFYVFFAFVFEFLFLSLFQSWNFTPLFSICLFSIFLLGYRFLMHFLFFRGVPYDFKGEFIFLFFLTLQILSVFFYPEFYVEHFVLKMFLESCILFFLIYFFSLVFRVKDVE